MEKRGLKDLKFLFVFLLEIIFFSNFISAVDITDCGYLNSADTTYVLQNNLTTTTTCFYLNATNITLDLNGYEVIYGNQNNDSVTFSGVYSNQTYSTLKNGSIRMGDLGVSSQDRVGIFFSTGADNGTIENINSSNGRYGIYLSSDYHTLTNVNSSYNKDYGIYLGTSHYNTFNNVITSYNSGYGFYLYFSDHNTLNNITSSYNSNHGIYLYSGSDYNYLSNVVTNYNVRGISGYNLVVGTVDHNTLENITSNYNSAAGIYFSGGDYTTIRNAITNFNGDSGTWLTSTSNYAIIDNLTSSDNNNQSGLEISSSSHAVITNVIANNNDRYGLVISGMNNGSFTNLTANSNANSGISFQSSFHNSNVTNFITNNNTRKGTYLLTSVYNVIFTNGIANSNVETGVYLNNSYNNNFTNITASSNLINGFYFWNASTGNIVNNSIINDSPYGLYFQNMSTGLPQSNVFYNNLINNTINTYNATSLVNYFNTTLTSGTNIMGRLYIGGNFWGTPSGTGFSDTCTDADKNGICDSSYNIDGVNIDYFPLYFADTSGPIITFSNYTNGTLKNISETLTLNISVDDVLSNVSNCYINVNGTNQSVTYSNGWCNLSSISLEGMSGGNNTIRIYANDSLNNFRLDDSYVVTIDAGEPAISISSPTNQTYSVSLITFNVYAEDDSGIVSSCNYSLNDDTNVSLDYLGGYWQATNSSMKEQAHNVTFYCWDSFGKIGSSTEYFTISIPEEGESNGGSSGGGSSITQNSALLQEKSLTIFLGKVIAFEKVDSVINTVGIDLTRTTVETNQNVSSASITIQTISKILNADLLTGLKEKNVYQGFKVKKTGLTDDNINEVILEFKIEKDWLAGRNVSSVILNRKADNSTEWSMLNTTLISEDTKYYYLKAVSPGFSLFAIYFDEDICTPGELFCSNDEIRLCKSDKSYMLIEKCEFGCSEGKCLDYWEPEGDESIMKRFTKLIFGTWLNFGTLVFMILVGILLLSLVLVSYVTYKFFERVGKKRKVRGVKY